MRKLREKIVAITEEKAIKELSNFILKDLYENIDENAKYIVYDLHSFSEDFFKKPENEQLEDIYGWISDFTYNHNYELVSEFFKDKNISQEDKEIYEDIHSDAIYEAMNNKQFLKTLKKKIDNLYNLYKQKNWNTKNNVDPEFNKGMNKINCIRVRLQKKLS